MNVYILLDRSGSMSNMWAESIGSINAYVAELPEKTNVFLAAFDTEYTVVRNSTVKKWKPIETNEITPRGNTRLFDSSARIMMRALDDNEEKTVVVVMTDGEENSSINFKQSDVKALAKSLEDKKWELIFLGANFDKVGDVARHYGVGINKFTDIKAGNMHEYMTASLATSTRAYASTGEAINISAEDKAKATK
jgi:uncharacterized protein with von Willebrand factor type A (vWA) domain